MAQLRRGNQADAPVGADDPIPRASGPVGGSV